MQQQSSKQQQQINNKLMEKIKMLQQPDWRFVHKGMPVSF